MSNLGVDTGGTFTDFVFLDDGKLSCFKILSSPANPADAVISGCKDITDTVKGFNLVHGTTVATNALLEGRYGKSALITTKGFEDILEIGRQNRSQLYNLALEKPRVLIPARRRFGISERVTVGGEVLKGVDRKELKRVIDQLKKEKVSALAICFLSSFANPSNEQLVEEAAQQLSIPVCASYKALREFREYERLTTTVINAALMPIMDGYLTRLEGALQGALLRIMQSNGGSVSTRGARLYPVRTILSGPAGGVLGAKEVAAGAGFKDIISFDMGGTSTDVGLVKGDIRTVSETKIDNLPVKVPVIDIHSVGAGGGSLAMVDPGGALQVGPQSAGADPGPICYGKGKGVTVTDANLYLGRIDPDYFLGGNMPLYKEKVKRYLAKLARELKLPPEEAAQGIIRVANTTMERALRVISVERGHDPRDFTLVSFGGAGGLHACDLARRLSIPRVLIPRNPGTLSALGMMLSDVFHEYAQSVLLKLKDVDEKTLARLFVPLIERATGNMAGAGFVPSRIRFLPSLDMRYEGQSYELNLPLSLKKLWVAAKGFHNLHQKAYGYAHPGRECEIVTLRLRAVGKTKKPQIEPWHPSRSKSTPPAARPGSIYYRGKWWPTPVYERDHLLPGKFSAGPMLIVEYSATHFIPPRFRMKVDEWGNLIILTPEQKGR